MTLGKVLPTSIESAIKVYALILKNEGKPWFYGYQMWKLITGPQSIWAEVDLFSGMSHATVYRALVRLEKNGILESRLETPAPEGRPRRRMYRLTGKPS